MASQRLCSPWLVARLSRLSVGSTSRAIPKMSLAPHTPSAFSRDPAAQGAIGESHRFFASGKKPDNEKGEDGGDDDPFGVSFDDTESKVGPPHQLPPMYKRDTTTGRFTGEIQAQLTEEDKKILQDDSIERESILNRRIEKHWESSGIDESGMPVELNELGRRVRETDMGLNVLGRSVKAQASTEQLDDGSELGSDKTGFSQNLTEEEFQSFSEYMKKTHKVDVSEEDIPMHDRSIHKHADAEGENPDEKALSLKWLTSRAQRQMDDLLDDNPYSDLMPGDLSPTRLVNRKRAKVIPRDLLHHNNIPLLQKFITPTGQVMNRVQSRLGARDQRRVSKLIKRARAIGLLPYTGQFKSERHGWKYAKDIGEDKEWEKELAKRGLTIKRGESGKNAEFD